MANIQDRGGMIIDLLGAHNLDQTDTNLLLDATRQISNLCGKHLDPNGGVQATKNGDQPIDSAVDWDELSR
ncbi:hypothetical protein [Gordonia polyisoprenivorans]|uniref:hypothetical protein n=1 Tax=Gordonia polyisoprenivorans TaxID=84595 RepID=UPI0012DED51D|nr:hypothetical protein [Gordonia polyisoprenivorans]